MSEVDAGWFRERIADLDISQNAFAKRVGMSPSNLSLTLKGKRQITITRAADFARELGVTLDDVVLHSGIDYGTADGDRIKIVGHIDGAGAASFENRTLGTVPAMGKMPPDTVALVMRTTQTDLDLMNGWIVFAGPVTDNVPTAVDRTALVKVRGAEKPLMRLIRRGQSAAIYTLTGIAQAPVYDAEIEWLRLLVAFRPL